MFFKRIATVLLTILALGAAPFSANAAVVKSDFVFIIDATGSMGTEIAGVRAGFSTFVNNLGASGIDARYSVILFGGAPELVLDFTSDGTAAQNALNNIVIGAKPGFQNNHNINPEAGLEAIRMALGGAAFNTLDTNNLLGYAGDGTLNYRGDARKNLILVTDEDSDCPFYVPNRFLGCGTGSSPPNFVGGPWQDEVDATAQAVIANDAFVNLLINVGDIPTKSQYGDYTKDVADPDLLNFDAAATLAALQLDASTANSLQAQVLAAGLIGRSFNVAGANDPNFVNNFFAAKIEETISNPPTIPEPSVLLLMGFGLTGLVFIRRKKYA